MNILSLRTWKGGRATLIGVIYWLAVGPFWPFANEKPDGSNLWAQSSRFRFDGEYGFWVESRGEQINVHWLTTPADSGFLNVFYKGRLLHEFKTALGQAHFAAFADRDLMPLKLVYGGQSAQEDLHETHIYSDKVEDKFIYEDVDSVFVFGDIHGEFENIVGILQHGKVIDQDLNWIGHKKHLVALGDIFDRGHDVTRTLWLLYRLDHQAALTGGRVHVVLGNHEIMTFCDDLRYLSGKENLIAQMHGTTYSEMYSLKNSLLGKWLAGKPGIIKINEMLFAHGGVDAVFRNWTIPAFNDTLRTYIQEDVFQYLLQDSLITTPSDSVKYSRSLPFFFAENSVFWHRAYVLSDTLQNELASVLKNFKSRVHVIAHTPVRTISERYEGRVIAVDLVDAASEVLLLVGRNTKKMKRYKINLAGEIIPLEAPPSPTN